MTVNPPTLRDLGAYWVEHGGVNLGVVGNASHTTGYHLGRDRIYDGSGPGIGDADYSVKLPRDRAGLSNAASAIDLGKLGGSLAGLRAFSVDLVARCMADHETRRDVREIIYSPDGVTVQRYSGVDNLIHTGPGNGDLSHRSHTHISFFRDSETRDKRPIFAPYFGEGPMPTIYTAPGLTSVTLPVDTPLLAQPDPDSDTLGKVTDPTRRYDVMGQDAPDAPDYYLVDDRANPSHAMPWVLVSSVRDQRSTPDGFYNQGVDAAVAAAATARREE